MAGIGASALVALGAAGGCGGARQDANEPSGNFPVQVVRATFPTPQRLAQTSQLQIAVRNAGRKTVPDLAISVLSGEANAPASAAAFEEASTEPGLADPSRPVWVLNDGPRGGVTAYTNTWALGALRPGQTRTFVWHVLPAVHDTATDVPDVPGVQVFVVSVQYTVLATPEPPVSLGVSVTV